MFKPPCIYFPREAWDLDLVRENSTTKPAPPWKSLLETVFWRSEGGSRDAMCASRGNQHTCRRPKTSMVHKLDLKLTKCNEMLHDNHEMFSTFS